MSDKKPVLLIDLSGIYFAKFHAQGDSSLNITERTIADVDKCHQGNYDRLVAICCDSGKSFRKDIDPQYKANRPEKDATLIETLNVTKEKLRDQGFLLWEAPGFEADDIIATAADKLVSDGHKVTIASSDKDLCQLVSDNVTSLSTQTWALRDKSGVKERFGVDPGLLGDWLALVGDKADNIAGATGIGEKTAAKLLNQYGSLNALYVALTVKPEDVLPTQKSAKENERRIKAGIAGRVLSSDAQALIDSKANVMLARKLVTLSFDAPIKVEEIYAERKPKSMSDEFSDIAISSGKSESAKVVPANDNTVAIGELVPAVETAVIATKAVDALTQFDSNLQPTGMAGAWWFVQKAVTSRLYSRKFGSPEAALMAVARGKDYGLSPAASLEMLQMIEGKICPPAQLLAAMAKRSPNCLYFVVEANGNTATARTKRKGSPIEETVTFTTEMAKKANLVKPGGAWEKSEEDMCVARASSKLARRVFPDETCGAYSFEEMQDVNNQEAA